MILFIYFYFGEIIFLIFKRSLLSSDIKKQMAPWSCFVNAAFSQIPLGIFSFNLGVSSLCCGLRPPHVPVSLGAGWLETLCLSPFRLQVPLYLPPLEFAGQPHSFLISGQLCVYSRMQFHLFSVNMYQMISFSLCWALWSADEPLLPYRILNEVLGGIRHVFCPLSLGVHFNYQQFC